MRSQPFEVQAAPAAGQHVGHRLDLLRQARGPRALHHGGLGRFHIGGVVLGLVLRAGVQGHLLALPRQLELGAQPAHGAGRFLGRALGVQLDQPQQQRVGVGGQGQVAPAVGLQHSGVQLVVQALEHAHQAMFVDHLLLGVVSIAAMIDSGGVLP